MLRSLVTLDEAKGSPVAFWLMACYAYEELDHGIMDDATFDALVAYMEDNWLDLRHPHIYLLNPAFLSSSVGARRPRIEWPLMVFGGCHSLMDKIYGPTAWGDAGSSYLKRLARDHVATVMAKSQPVPGADLV